MNADSSEHLHRAVTLARGGARAQACQVLRELVKTEPQYEQAWLWLSDFSDESKEQIHALRRALAINPGNAYARARLAQLQGQHPKPTGVVVDPVVRARSEHNYLQARAALKKGQKQTALELLLRNVNQDQTHMDTWLLLNELAPDIDDQIVGLENALVLEQSSPQMNRRRYQRTLRRLETLKLIRADPLATGEMYELNGQLDRALFAYLEAGMGASNAADRWEGQLRHQVIQLRQKMKGYTPIQPNVNLVRLTLGPALLFGALLFIQGGIIPFAPSPLLCASSLAVLLGSFLLFLARTDNTRTRWYSHWKLRPDRRWTGCGLWLAGVMLIGLPFILLALDTVARYPTWLNWWWLYLR